MKNIMNVALGIVTSIGGFQDVGAIATAALAGAAVGVQMVWVRAVGTRGVMFLTEMSGRLACVSHHSLVDAIRERCGFRYFSFLLIGELIVDLLVLAAEIGGVAVALHLITGIDYRWFVPIVAFEETGLFAVPLGIACTILAGLPYARLVHLNWFR